MWLTHVSKWYTHTHTQIFLAITIVIGSEIRALQKFLHVRRYSIAEDTALIQGCSYKQHSEPNTYGFSDDSCQL